MKKTEIIKKNYEFKYFFKKGKYIPGKLLELFIFPSKFNRNRIGIIVSKKVGGSVIRNKIKRYIREAYKELEEKLEVNSNMLIIWKKCVSYEKANFFDVEKDLKELLINAGVLNNDN